MTRVVRETGYEETLAPPEPYAVPSAPVVSSVPSSVAVVDDRVTRTRWPSPAQVLIGVVAGALLVFGIVAIARGGFSGPLNEPSFTLLGIRHTAMIGVGEVVGGLLLAFCALASGLRGLSGFLGLVMVAGGIAVVADLSTRTRLHTNRGLGWLSVVLGAVVLLSSLIDVRRTDRRRVVTRS